MLISRDETDGYIVDTYSSGAVVKNIKSKPIEQEYASNPEPTQADRIEANLDYLVLINS